MSFSYLEFFAGGGMVRAGLGDRWTCLLANDFCGKKALAYQENWGLGGELHVGPVADLISVEKELEAELAWASFPCQDLSVAGNGGGLSAKRSGAFFDFWKALTSASKGGATPPIVVIENVCGLIRSNGGNDFRTLLKVFRQHGYFCGGMVVDASDFLPQSRKRLFVVGIRHGLSIDPSFLLPSASGKYFPRYLQDAVSCMPMRDRDNWIWFNMAPPERRRTVLADLLEDDDAVEWDAAERTSALLASMSSTNAMKVKAAQNSGRRTVGGVFKRTRISEKQRQVRAEVRFDEIAGCLRTPNGGSSRQTVMVIEGRSIRTRLINPRETARLMGLDDTYKLPRNKNAALHLTGDGVAVPVVRFLRDRIFEPVLEQNGFGSRATEHGDLRSA